MQTFTVEIDGVAILIHRDTDGKFVVPDGWRGIGSALKPANEPICLARRPLEGTIAGNILRHGTGALNIDGCRIEGESTLRECNAGTGNRENWRTGNEAGTHGSDQGRWPANLCHDGSDEVLAGFPETHGAGTFRHGNGAIFGGCKGEAASEQRPAIDEGGSAARFFYTAKASSDERGEGNNHPTVKPIALMRWLCRLVTPPGGTILDPFMGSGSTLIAADAEQFNAIGCELSPEYAAIAERRIKDAAGMFADVRVAA